MSIGNSGCGKSTILNIFYKSNFKTGKSIHDVTQEMTCEVINNMRIVDTVGFLPSLHNIGKMFILFFYRGFFPDYFIFPINNDRLEDVKTLRLLIDMGFIKTIVVPFNSKVYYNAKKYTTDINAFGDALSEDLVQSIKDYITASEWNGKVEVLQNAEIPAVTGSMKNKFFSEFFQNGIYKPLNYEIHIEKIKENGCDWNF